MKSDIAEIKNTIAAINATLSEAKGGWKTLMWIGGASGAVSALFTHMAHTWIGK